jgi:hypothetical protein
VLALLAFSTEGKAAAVAANVVPALCSMMAWDAASMEREAAAGAAMVIAVDDDGKRVFVEYGLEPFVSLLSDAESMVRINAMRAITTIAANPKGRAAWRALGVDARLARIVEGSGTGVEHDVAVKAIEAVSWTA